ncbi:hypothetical protein COX95_04195 [bacterium CG_4_10_14_0_2_um_filter_33_32]|nr:MAG: hypothetical protein AUJ93_00030 [bacterium CG2_30_33_46]PIR67600.1 MAG: hypothetical protein COU50_02435 [bacterium CG10_big_fil_rev_8_21_14_0_10_33_18]PIU77155.1 MAG: hypothetical protein COS74_00290 [bacterium CG06_land_8_20_14_3_00_33_50]PIW81376.1 MAG: hypothetical protein COZ97_02095 [bacterium CG_4_8_14_3_um_filter_33_28]PIY85175.1 MAG: hypothetical protein COY76_03525 [bacterium CG_4_10_14_0_8_um_filter_33_57]PIZ85428.1 MAG: hypothetical protein COX95_04195 [bacterium CG_4_10_1
MGHIFERKTFLAIFFIFLGLEIIVFYPDYMLFVLTALLIFFVFALSAILKIKPKDKHAYPVFILPMILLVEFCVFLLVIPVFSLKQLFIFASAFLLYLVIFSLNALKSRFVSYSLIIFNIITIAFLISVFFSFVIIFDLYLIVGLQRWLAMLIFGTITLLSFWFNIWQNNLSVRNMYTHGFVLTMIITEFFWVLTFWPLLALSSGFILFTIYYIYIGLFNSIIKSSFNKKVVLNHTIIPFLVLVYFIISARW